MKNAEIADIFAQMADLMEILGEDTFRINSYRKAARIIGELPDAIEDLAAQDRLEEVEGVGKSTAEKIRQYLASGRIERHQELLAKAPQGLQEMMGIPGIGPKTILHLWKQAGITSLEQLRQTLESDPARLLAVERMSEKKIQQLAESLKFVASSGGRIPLGEADAIARDLMELVRHEKGVRRIEAAGSLRRGMETVGDIDLCCEGSRRDAPGIIESFTAGGQVRRVLAKGSTKGSVVLAHNVQADLRVIEGESFGAALCYFTGSKSHNVHMREIAQKKGLKLNEYGLFKGDKAVAGADERGVYEALGLEFVPPELREDHGEIEAAMERRLPRLVEPAEIRGDFHMHTTASDGANSIQEMIDACRQRGYHAMAITDHSKSQPQAGGLNEEEILQHAAAIRKAAMKHPDMLVLAGVELDILKDGSLDFPDSVLAELDFVLASPHAALKMGRQEATRRMLRAIESGRVHCIGHPTGRLVKARPGMELDIDEIAKAAARCNVALEVNAHYVRLDLRDVHIRAAIEHGAKLMVNTDAHVTHELAMMKYGVTTARRGWATAADVLNTCSAAELKQWLKRA